MVNTCVKYHHCWWNYCAETVKNLTLGTQIDRDPPGVMVNTFVKYHNSMSKGNERQTICHWMLPF